MKRTAKFSLVMLLAVLIAALAVTFTACNDNDEQNAAIQLSAPTIQIDGTVLSWTAVEHADRYLIFDGNDKIGETEDINFDVSSAELSRCELELTVKAANSTQEYSISKSSNVVTAIIHTLGDEWIEDSPASCTAKAHHHKECENCDHREDEDYGEMLPHQWEENLTADNHKKCSICGTEETLYEERDGKIYFGEYPQTKETDNGITATLAQMSGNRPVNGNAGKWTDYGYYVGIDTDNDGYNDTLSKEEYMWYIDLEYGDAKYRGVYFTSYRPIGAIYSSSTAYTDQDDNGYYINTLYWFKWEPIEWRVLEKVNGEAFLMSSVILDSQQYYRGENIRSIDDETVFSNNYKESDIRAWLNNSFYNQAFDEFEQAIINETLVDNSAATTASSSNGYACENTYDKVFLLSYKDVLNTNYGFSSSYSNYDTARRLKTTGYAQSQGAYTLTYSSDRGNGRWWLRSPSNIISYALSVYDSGDVCGSDVICTFYGVVPALRITM